MRGRCDGGGCTCTGTVNHTGSIGWLTAGPADERQLHHLGQHAHHSTATANYAYCVSGNKLTLSPQPHRPTSTGTIVLTKSGTSGTGGTSGTAGTTGTAGTSGTGGTSGAAGSGAGRPATGGRGGTTGAAGNGGTAGTRGHDRNSRNNRHGRAAAEPAEARHGRNHRHRRLGTGRVEGPCDIYAAAGTPCGAAYSTIRALSKTYTGPLYQVRSGSSAMNTGSGGTTKDIGRRRTASPTRPRRTPSAAAPSARSRSSMTSPGTETTSRWRTQGLTNGGTYAAMDDFESSATKGMLMVGGHKVYSLYMNAREGYRTAVNVKAKDVPIGNTAQGIYELADGTHAGTAMLLGLRQRLTRSHRSTSP